MDGIDFVALVPLEEGGDSGGGGTCVSTASAQALNCTVNTAKLRVTILSLVHTHYKHGTNFQHCSTCRKATSLMVDFQR
eukprot:5284236-Ditylum_brightwellii.AAC.1